MQEEIKDFLNNLKIRKKASENTIVSYERDLKNFFKTIDYKSTYRVNKTDVMKYILILEQENKSSATIARHLSTLHNFFTYLVKHGALKEDPTEYIKSPKVEKKEMKYMSQDDVEKLLNMPDLKTKKGLRDRAILEILYATGIKITELIELKISDINLDVGYVKLKSRTVPIGKEANIRTYNYIKNSRLEMLDGKMTDILFINVSGEKLTRQGLWKIIKAYSDEVNKSITATMIRNSFANHLLANGADIMSLKEMLGHSELNSTKAYLKPINKKIKEIYESAHPRA